MKCEYSWFNETEESCVVVMCHSCLLVGKDSSFSITLWQTIGLKKVEFYVQSESSICAKYIAFKISLIDWI
jgi:hypothetical protein